MRVQSWLQGFCIVVWTVFSCTQLHAQVVYLEQNWTPEVRQSFYTTTQGSRIMPYAWFLALEVSDSHESFVKTLPKLGYIENDTRPITLIVCRWVLWRMRIGLLVNAISA